MRQAALLHERAELQSVLGFAISMECRMFGFSNQVKSIYATLLSIDYLIVVYPYRLVNTIFRSVSISFSGDVSSRGLKAIS